MDSYLQDRLSAVGYEIYGEFDETEVALADVAAEFAQIDVLAIFDEVGLWTQFACFAICDAESSWSIKARGDRTVAIAISRTRTDLAACIERGYIAWDAFVFLAPPGAAEEFGTGFAEGPTVRLPGRFWLMPCHDDPFEALEITRRA